VENNKIDAAVQRDTARTMEIVIRLALAIGLVIWCFAILEPFLSTIIWALILAAALFPAYNWALNKFGKSRGLTAFVFTAVVFLALMTPILMLSGTLVETAREVAQQFEAGKLAVPEPSEAVREWPVVGDKIYAGWELAHSNLVEALGRFQGEIRKVGRWLLTAVAGAGLGILQFAVALVIAGVFLAFSDGGGEFARRLGRRLMGERGELVATLASSTVRSVAQGVLGVAFIQSIMAGIAFLAIGIPGAGLWTLLVMILATVQLPVGVVLIPSIFYVFSIADTVPAVIYTIWIIIVSVIDNILKPFLLGRGASVPMAVIFLGAIGGFLLSGIVGLFLGAVALVLGYELFILWLYMDDPELLEQELKRGH
jgi:predicted PurR-regulated permease PerM